MKIETTKQVWAENIRFAKPQETATAKAVTDRVDLALPKHITDAEPEVRTDRIEAVRARMVSGFYDRADIREEIAASFLKAQIA